MYVCEKCNISVNVPYGSNRFCSQKCARSFATYKNRVEINNKVSETLTGRIAGTKEKRSTTITRQCKNCGNQLILGNKSKRQYCNHVCTVQYLFNPDKNKEYVKLIEKFRAAGHASLLSQGSKRSKNEIYFAQLCETKFEITTNEPFFDGWDADVIIHDLKLAILWNGPWHYKQITKSGNTLARIQARDRIKLEKILAKGYVPYIIRDNGKFNKKFVEAEFSELLNNLGV